MKITTRTRVNYTTNEDKYKNNYVKITYQVAAKKRRRVRGGGKLRRGIPVGTSITRNSEKAEAGKGGEN